MSDKQESFVEKISDRNQFAASAFNDEIAFQTSWHPAKKGGTNFQTHKLVEKGHKRLEFVPTLGAKLFCGFFATVGVVFICYKLYSGIGVQQDNSLMETLLAYLFGLTFLVGGIGFYYFKALPRVFDKLAGLYWKGHKKPVNKFDSDSGGEYARLTDIHAIQLLSERIYSKKNNRHNRSYLSYELNLVLKNGERLNVVDHGKKSAIVADAKKLAAFLGKPVWDASDMI